MGGGFTFKRWMGLAGFLGFLSLIPNYRGEPNYFSAIFFSFFAFYFWAKLEEQPADERLDNNRTRALRVLAPAYLLLSFFLLFSLDRSHIPRETILLWGSLAYAAISILAPALVYYFDRVAE